MNGPARDPACRSESVKVVMTLQRESEQISFNGDQSEEAGVVALSSPDLRMGPDDSRPRGHRIYGRSSVARSRRVESALRVSYFRGAYSAAQLPRMS